MNLPMNLPVRCKKAVPLSKHTTFLIGGPAQYWVEPADAAQLERLLAWCRKNKKNVRIIGAGSNILASDRGVKGVIVRLTGPFFTAISRTRGGCLVGAGTTLASLVAYCTQQGLSGAEFLSGIPGTVGGALAGNAGTRDKSIGDLVEFVLGLDYNGAMRKLTAADLAFSYRSSNLNDCVIVQACLKLVKRNKAAIRNTIARYAEARKKDQGPGWRSAGCVFKNPKSDSAGRLIDACGFKGARIGSAVVSRRHANFILNEGRATSADVLALMRRITAGVQRRFGIRLEPEIKIWR
jgi:UDP-N-acetylmuramate dehydrogenase